MTGSDGGAGAWMRWRRRVIHCSAFSKRRLMQRFMESRRRLRFGGCLDTSFSETASPLEWEPPLCVSLWTSFCSGDG